MMKFTQECSFFWYHAIVHQEEWQQLCSEGEEKHRNITNKKIVVVIIYKKKQCVFKYHLDIRGYETTDRHGKYRKQLQKTEEFSRGQ